MKHPILVLSLGLSAALASFAVRADEPRAYSAYAHYVLRDIGSDVKVHPKVMEKLTTELKLKLDQPMAQWNAIGAQSGHAGTLAIEVTITDMKFVSGGKRFWAGGFAGSSHAAGTVKLVDVESGKVLTSQTFNNKAGGVAGAWSIGATDNAMLDHLAANMGSWVIAIHDGAPPPPTDTAEPEDKPQATN